MDTILPPASRSPEHYVRSALASSTFRGAARASAGWESWGNLVARREKDLLSSGSNMEFREHLRDLPGGWTGTQADRPERQIRKFAGIRHRRTILLFQLARRNRRPLGHGREEQQITDHE